MSQRVSNPASIIDQSDFDKVVLTYKGPINDMLLAEFSQNLRNKLQFLETGNSTGKKVFAIFMELAQNVLFYSKEVDEFDGSDKVGTIAVLQNDEMYKVLAGNVILKKSTEKLIAKCETINSLDRDALREYKIQLRAAPKEEESRGAGIGLVHVALTSDNSIEMEIKDIDHETAFYVVGVNINRQPAASSKT